MSIDDVRRCPLLLIDLQGGTGIEERADSVLKLHVDPVNGIDADAIRDMLRDTDFKDGIGDQLVDAIVKIVDLAKNIEARTFESQPPGYNHRWSRCRD